MIDFRYHLVSLISVFLALAVGIILGAGPLQDAIGNQLQDQVDQIRSERNSLRGKLDTAEATKVQREEFLTAAGPQLVAGTLTGRRVAIVDLDAVDDSRDAALADTFAASGATVVATVQLGDAWTDGSDSAQRTRKTAAGGLGDLLPAPTSETSSEERLAEALVAALTQESTALPGTLSDKAVQLGDQLQQLSELVTFVGEQTQPANVILLVTGDTKAPADGATATAKGASADGVVAIQADLAVAAQQGVGAALVAGPTARSGDLISSIRGDRKLSDVVSTVSGIESESGMISVPLALAARLGGEVGQFGAEDSATAVLPKLPVSAPSTSPAASSSPAATTPSAG